MLDRIDDLVQALKSNPGLFVNRGVARTGSLYCPTCGDERRMGIVVLNAPPDLATAARNGFLGAQKITEFVPSLILLACVQCETRFTCVIYDAPDGPDAVILPSVRGGLTTPHTPEGVAYYLDQAHRAEVVGARSAAIAMYRGALEHLLFEQGYKTGMLGKKLEALESAVGKGAAPKWAADLDTEFLAVLKDLGNGSIHPNDGDVTKQSVLDEELLRKVRQTFLMLLFLVYEAPHKKQEHLAALKTKAQILKK